MQFSNDNFDELFQRAADDYPLKIDNAQWDIVDAQLHRNALPQKFAQGRKWRYAALLLLLLSGTFFIIKNSGKVPGVKASTQQEQKSAPGAKVNDNTAAHPQEEASADNTSNLPVLTQTSSNAHNLPAHKDIFTGKSSGDGESQPQISQTAADQEVLPPSDQNNLQSNQNNLQSKSNNAIQPGNPGLSADKITSSNNLGNISSKPGTVAGNQQEAKNKNQVALKPQVKVLPRQKTIYGSLFIAPELSTVKFQHTDKLGYRIGVALGYRINKHFSLELGVQREHKNFFSDGKYFDRSRLKLKESTSIEALNGSTKLTNVPVSIRYNFSSHTKGQFFATAGVSTMLVTHNEKYDYAITKDGSPDNLTRNFSSLTSTKYFSGVNASIGYETPLGNLCRLKVEPYYQTATHGLGIGDLPVSSFGINVGIVKDLK